MLTSRVSRISGHLSDLVEMGQLGTWFVWGCVSLVNMHSLTHFPCIILLCKNLGYEVGSLVLFSGRGASSWWGENGCWTKKWMFAVEVRAPGDLVRFSGSGRIARVFPFMRCHS